MVIPASMNQIHGGAQLIRLVLTSISALMIKTLQKALTQPGSGVSLPRPPMPQQTQLWDAGALKKLVGNSPVPSSEGTPPHGRGPGRASCLAATAPEVLLGFAKAALTRIPGREGRRRQSGSRELQRVLQ